MISTWAATSAVKTKTKAKEEHENEVQNFLAAGSLTWLLRYLNSVIRL